MAPKFVIKKPQTPEIPKFITPRKPAETRSTTGTGNGSGSGSGSGSNSHGPPRFKIAPSQTGVFASQNNEPFSTVPLTLTSSRLLRAGLESPLKGKRDNEEVDDDTIGLNWSPSPKKNRTYTKPGGMTDIVQSLLVDEEQNAEVNGRAKYGDPRKVVSCTRWNRLVWEVTLDATEEAGEDIESEHEAQDTGEDSYNLKNEMEVLLLSASEVDAKNVRMKQGRSVQLGRPLTVDPVISYLDWSLV